MDCAIVQQPDGGRTNAALPVGQVIRGKVIEAADLYVGTWCLKCDEQVSSCLIKWRLVCGLARRSAALQGEC